MKFLFYRDLQVKTRKEKRIVLDGMSGSRTRKRGFFWRGVVGEILLVKFLYGNAYFLLNLKAYWTVTAG